MSYLTHGLINNSDGSLACSLFSVSTEVREKTPDRSMRGKQTYKETKIRIIPSFISKIMQARREENEIYRVESQNHDRILYPEQ